MPTIVNKSHTNIVTTHFSYLFSIYRKHDDYNGSLIPSDPKILRPDMKTSALHQ